MVAAISRSARFFTVESAHYFLALRGDRSSLAPLESLLEATRLLDDGERIVAQTLLDPAPRDWWTGPAQAYESARRGGTPRRIDLDAATVVHYGVQTLAGAALEALAMVREFIADETPAEGEWDLDASTRAQMLRDGSMSAATLANMRGDGYDPHSAPLGLEKARSRFPVI